MINCFHTAPMYPHAVSADYDCERQQ